MSLGRYSPNEVGFFMLELLARPVPDGYAHHIGQLRVPIVQHDFEPNKFVIELGPILDKLREALVDV